MSAVPPDEPAEPPQDPVDPSAAATAEMNAVLDDGLEALREQARAWGAEVRRVQALMAASKRAQKAGVPQFLHLEMAGSWRISQATAQRWMMEADRFDEALPRTLELLESGQLLRGQAWVLLERTMHCPVDVARRVEAAVLAADDALLLSPSDLGRRVEREVLRIESEQADPAAAEQRHENAVAERRTFVRAEPDGMGVAGAVLPAEKLIAWQSALDALERRERRADRAAGIERTAEQRRADIFATLPAMVLTALQAADAARDSAAEGELDLGVARFAHVPWTFSPEQVAATVLVNVHVPVSTVLDLTHEPGSIDRYGPISAEHARLLRPASLRRVMVDSRTGRPIAVDDRPTPAADDPAQRREQVQEMLRPAVVVDADEPQHDPSARLARLIDLRDVRCAGPGCSASRCDRDHHTPWPAGPTSARNLGLLSRRCHLAKHHGWTLIRHPDGSVTWHSPLGRDYDKPSPHQPPQPTDLYADPPPLRERPQPPPPRWNEDQWDEPHEQPPASAEREPDVHPEPDDDLPPF